MNADFSFHRIETSAKLLLNYAIVKTIRVISAHQLNERGLKVARKKTDSELISTIGKSSEELEAECIALAYAEALERLKNHTASSQVISYFLKVGSPSVKIERETKLLEQKLIQSKTRAMDSARSSADLANAAIEAFKRYSGIKDDE